MENRGYETAAEAADRMGVTPRAVQKWASSGKIPGAVKHGRSWLIPRNAGLAEHEKKEQSGSRNRLQAQQKRELHGSMPLLNSAYPIGKVMEYINGMEDPADRDIALLEYYFFSGQSEKAAREVTKYQNSKNPSQCFSANLIATFSNLAGGHIYAARFAMRNLQEQVRSALRSEDSVEEQAIGVFTATAALVLLHLPVPGLPPLEEYMKYLPEGLRLYSCYVLAHKAYLEKDYNRSLACVDVGLAMCKEVYPIVFVYLHVMAAIALINMKRPQEAEERLVKAWEIAEPDQLIHPFGEHHGLLQGLIEIFFKERYPELHKKIDQITYSFSAGWRAIHNPDTRHEVADNLSTLEFTIAMLYSRNWTAIEIGDHLGMSERTVYNRMEMIYSKLGISDKKELDQYMLR